MPEFVDQEALIQQLLLDSGVVAALKEQHIYIWSINQFPGRVTFSVDMTRVPKADIKLVERMLQEVLKGLEVHIDAYKLSMDELCCLRGCKGCLNGNEETQAVWIL